MKLPKFLIASALIAAPMFAQAADLPSAKSAPLPTLAVADYWSTGVYAGLSVGAGLGSTTNEISWEGDGGCAAELDPGRGHAQKSWRCSDGWSNRL